MWFLWIQWQRVQQTSDEITVWYKSSGKPHVINLMNDNDFGTSTNGAEVWNKRNEAGQNKICYVKKYMRLSTCHFFWAKNLSVDICLLCLDTILMFLCGISLVFSYTIERENKKIFRMPRTSFSIDIIEYHSQLIES